MIVFDTETTGLIQKGQKLDKQPEIVEFGGIKLDDETLEEVGRLNFLCKPRNLCPPDAVNIHKITNEMLADEKSFSAYVPQLQEFFFGERTMVAHNCPYDMKMMSFELQRLEVVQKFPWPMNHICTVERTYDINNYRLNLQKLHVLATGEEFAESHRAMPDVEALCRCVRWLRKENRL